MNAGESQLSTQAPNTQAAFFAVVFLQPVELAGLGEAALGVGHAGDRAVLGEGLPIR